MSTTSPTPTPTKKHVKLTTVMGNMGTAHEPTFTTSRRKKYAETTNIRNSYLMALRELGGNTQKGDDENPVWSWVRKRERALGRSTDQRFCSMISKGHYMEIYRSEWPELTEKDTKKIDQAYKRSLKPSKRKVPTADSGQTTKTVAVENDDGTVESKAPATMASEQMKKDLQDLSKSMRMFAMMSEFNGRPISEQVTEPIPKELVNKICVFFRTYDHEIRK